MLAELAETQAPELVSLWPQTFAWKVVYGLIIFWLLTKVWRKYQDYKANAYRREALAWLQSLPEFDEHNISPQYRQLPALLKSTALHRYSRAEVNQASVGNWEHWLDSQCKKSRFSDNCPSLLSQLAYAPKITLERSQMLRLLAEIKIWIQYHGVGDV